MATISNKSIIEAGAQAGKEFAAGQAALSGGLVSTIRPLMLSLPKGKAVVLMDAFWTAFATGAGKCAARARVTKSESLRIARGIDAGVVLDDAQAWGKWVAAGPKSTGGKGAGGGRKPRPTDGTAPADAMPKTPMQMLRQPLAMMLAITAAHKARLPANVCAKIQELAAIVASIPLDE